MASLTPLSTENEDHHCVWLNNCIGRRNYRSFFIFINTASILCLYTLAFSIIHVISLYLDGSPEPSFLSAIQQAPVSFALVILCFVLLWSVGGLTGYHCYLALSGVTTHEQVS
jgi:palmitoyltransferase ZDHHC9/14/18